MLLQPGQPSGPIVGTHSSGNGERPVDRVPLRLGAKLLLGKGQHRIVDVDHSARHDHARVGTSPDDRISGKLHRSPRQVPAGSSMAARSGGVTWVWPT